jgi:hypothetical protein
MLSVECACGVILYDSAPARLEIAVKFHMEECNDFLESNSTRCFLRNEFHGDCAYA